MKPILIIDDDPRNIFALTATLKARGLKCVAAQDVKQAMAFTRQTEPSLVLMDMMMPEMDGYEAIPKFKSMFPELPVIAVTAQAMLGDRERCIEAGADDYVPKPIDVDKLMHLINKFI
ncbi:MAG: response regulator [Chitinophagaceae bacterium]|nr:MAG: response regulator [Chitinophagaceae bacterium]